MSGVTALAQRAGGGAKGGSSRPDRSQPQREERRSQISTIVGPTVTVTPAPTPQASPSPETAPEELCDPNEEGQCPGKFKLIYGVSINDRARHAEAASPTTTGGFAFNVYVTPRVWFEIDNDNFVSTKQEGGDRITGVGDTVLILGADALLEKDESRRPGIWVAYAIKLPTASAAKLLGTGEIDHSLTGAILKTLGDNYFELDFTQNFSGRTGTSGYDRSSDLLGVYERTFSNKNMFHVEIGGTFATKTSNASMYNLDYLEHSFNDRVGFRIGGRFGLTPNSPRIGFYGAFVFKGNLRRLFR